MMVYEVHERHIDGSVWQLSAGGSAQHRLDLSKVALPGRRAERITFLLVNLLGIDLSLRAHNLCKHPAVAPVAGPDISDRLRGPNL